MRIMALAGALLLLGATNAAAQGQLGGADVQALLQQYQSGQAGGAAGGGQADTTPGAGRTATPSVLTPSNPLLGASAGQPQARDLSATPAAVQNTRDEVQGYVDTTDGQHLPVFGAQLFTGSFASTRPTEWPDYVLQPGDRVVINLFGAVNNGGNQVVDATGNVFVTGVGPVHVGGIPLRDLQKTISSQVSRVFTNAVGVYATLDEGGNIGVFVSGDVKRPGRFLGTSHDSVLFFLQQAGGIDQDRGSMRSVTVSRNGQVMGVYDLYDFLLSGQVRPLRFQEGDMIFVAPRGAMVGVSGPVLNAYAFEAPAGASRMTGADILPLARLQPKVTGAVVHGFRNGAPRSAYFGLPDLSRVVLGNGDHLDFRSDQFVDTVTVNIQAQIKGQTVFVLPRGATLSQLLAKIPLQGTDVEPRWVHVQRPEVAVEQKRALQEALFNLQKQVLTAAPSTADAAALATAQATLVNQFVERAQSVQPDGNISVYSNGLFQDLLLQDGDTVVLPNKTDVVVVAGEILNPGGLAHANDLTIRGYVDRAGGFAAHANKKRFVLRHRDGSAVVAEPGDKPLPGDTIVVVPKVGSEWFQWAKDVSQLLFQVAVTAGTVNNLLK